MSHSPSPRLIADGHADIDRLVHRLQASGKSPSVRMLPAHAHSYTVAALTVAPEIKRVLGGEQANGYVQDWLVSAKRFERDVLEAKTRSFHEPFPQLLLRSWKTLEGATRELSDQFHLPNDEVQIRVVSGHFSRVRLDQLQSSLNSKSPNLETPRLNVVRPTHAAQPIRTARSA